MPEIPIAPATDEQVATARAWAERASKNGASLLFEAVSPAGVLKLLARMDAAEGECERLRAECARLQTTTEQMREERRLCEDRFDRDHERITQLRARVRELPEE